MLDPQDIPQRGSRRIGGGLVETRPAGRRCSGSYVGAGTAGQHRHYLRCARAAKSLDRKAVMGGRNSGWSSGIHPECLLDWARRQQFGIENRGDPLLLSEQASHYPPGY